MLELRSALIIVGILMLIVGWIMYSGNQDMQSWLPWLFAGSGAALLLAGSNMRRPARLFHVIT